jgi:hypothetical protein
MTNRREILQAAAVSVFARGARAGGRPAGSRLHAVLIDRRHAEARTLGADLTGRGAPVYALPDGDITQLWLHQIDPAWRQKPVPVAGLTERPALFCLEQLGFTHRLRVVFHGEHIVHPDGRSEHALLRGAAAAELSTRDLVRAGPLWPALIAEVIANHRVPTRGVRAGRSEAALAPALPAGAHLLTSWIIAAV